MTHAMNEMSLFVNALNYFLIKIELSLSFYQRQMHLV